MSAPSVPAPDVSGRRSAGQVRQEPPRSYFWGRFDLKVTPYLLIAPFFILFGIFGLGPLAYNIVVSFQRYDLVDSPGETPFIGLENYRWTIDDPDFWQSIKNSFGLFIFSSVPQILFALILAGLLNRKLRAQTLLRMGVLLPYVTPIAASSLVFGTVFAKNGGLVNSVLDVVGIAAVDWQADIWSSWTAIITMVNWRWTGYNTLIYLAAMQAIPKDLYEAATVDGAGVWRQFWRITVPLIKPTLLFTVIMTCIGGLQLFTEPLLYDPNPASALGGGGNYSTAALYIYKTAWRDNDFGTAAAQSVLLFFMIVIMSVISSLALARLGGRK